MCSREKYFLIVSLVDRSEKKKHPMQRRLDIMFFILGTDNAAEDRSQFWHLILSLSQAHFVYTWSCVANTFWMQRKMIQWKFSDHHLDSSTFFAHFTVRKFIATVVWLHVPRKHTYTEEEKNPKQLTNNKQAGNIYCNCKYDDVFICNVHHTDINQPYTRDSRNKKLFHNCE